MLRNTLTLSNTLPQNVRISRPHSVLTGLKRLQNTIVQTPGFWITCRMKESFVLIFLLKVEITMRIVCKCYTSDLSASFLFAGEIFVLVNPLSRRLS